MHPRPVVPYLLPLLLALLAAPVQAASGDVVGQVITATGEVAAVGGDGERRTLARRDPVYEGDTLVTGDPGRAQIRFKDQGLSDLRPSTRFKIKKYRAGEATGDKEKGVFMELVEGGLRTITGVVGKENRKDYRLNTPVASIGIRGTQYQVNFCQSDCGGGAPGLYGGVADGAIGVSNQGGSATYGRDHYFYVASADQAPQGLLAPPEGVLGRHGGGEMQQSGDDQGEGEEEGDGLADGEGEGGEGQEGGEDSGEVRAGLAGAVDDAEGEELASGGGLSAEEYEAGDETISETISERESLDPHRPDTAILAFLPPLEVQGLENSFPVYSGAVDAAYDQAEYDFGDGGLRSVTFTDADGDQHRITKSGDRLASGEDADLGLRWGHWAEYEYSVNGSPLTLSPNFHYVHAESLTQPDQLADLSGTATYAWADGSVSYGFAEGGASVDRLQLGVDFNAQSLTTADLVLNGETIDGVVDLELAEQAELYPAMEVGLVDSTGEGDEGDLLIQFIGDTADGAGVAFTGLDNDGGVPFQGSGIVVRQ